MYAKTSRTNRVSVYADDGTLIARYAPGQISEDEAMQQNSPEAVTRGRQLIVDRETRGMSSAQRDAYDAGER